MAASVLAAASLFIGWSTVVTGLDNGLASVPPLGFNTWYAFGCANNTESAAVAVANALVDQGYVAAGYRYFVFDDCWEAMERDAEGNLQPDPVRFPRGMRWMSDFLAGKNLGLGLYTTPGNVTCEKRPASGGHEVADARQWVQNWNVSYVKDCMCNTTREWRRRAYGIQERAIAAATKASGRLPVMFECDPFPDQPWKWAGKDCNLYAAHNDVADSWASWLGAVDDLMAWGVSAYSGPGRWSLVDFLQVGNGGQNEAQYRAQISVYVVLASPLFVSTDLRGHSAGGWVARLYTNRRVLAVHQDSLATAGGRLGPRNATGTETWVRPLVGEGRGVVLLNRGARPAEQCVSFHDLWWRPGNDGDAGPDVQAPPHRYYLERVLRRTSIGAPAAPAAADVVDIWSGGELGRFHGRFCRNIPPESAVFVRLAPH